MKRMEQRYGIRVSRKDYQDACDAIRRGESRFIARQSWRVTIHDVTVRGTTIRVAYDRQRGLISTALPPESWEGGEP